MRKMDQGLGAIGLIVLAVALSALLTVGIPISVSERSVELKDWLGFAGNVVGAAVTLVAAFVAWRAVQAQIRVQQDATFLNILVREEDRIKKELVALELMGAHLGRAIVALEESSGVMQFSHSLAQSGFSTDYWSTLQAIQEKASSDLIGLTALEVFVATCTEIKRTAEIAADIEGRAAGLYGEKRKAALSAANWDEADKELDEAKARLYRMVKYLEDEHRRFYWRMNDYRRRIVAVLGEAQIKTEADYHNPMT